MAVPCAGAGHTVHEAPHALASRSFAQVDPHGWKPALHAKPHVPDVHVAVPFAGTMHAVQELPQLDTEVSPRHMPPHAW